MAHREGKGMEGLDQKSILFLGQCGTAYPGSQGQRGLDLALPLNKGHW